MSRFTKSRPLKVVFYVIVGLIAIYLVRMLIIPSIVEGFASRHERAAFGREYSVLSGPLQKLGVPEFTDRRTECLYDAADPKSNDVYCHTFVLSNYGDQAISHEALRSFTANANSLEALLRHDGWSLDRPQDPITRLAGINPYTAANGGKGGTIPYHKNIGSISCNLDINFDGLNIALGNTPGMLWVNEFSCSQHIHSDLVRYFTPIGGAG
jgi:hypothetical protein